MINKIGITLAVLVFFIALLFLIFAIKDLVENPEPYPGALIYERNLMKAFPKNSTNIKKVDNTFYYFELDNNLYLGEICFNHGTTYLIFNKIDKL